MKIIFEAHATTLDNEAGVCSGWNDVALSEAGEKQAIELGQRYRMEDLDAIFTADLQRTYRTAEIAFPDISTDKLFKDWRLRECNYGKLTLSPKAELDDKKLSYLREPFPGGESYGDSMIRMKSFIDDLRLKNYEQILIIGSRATHYGLDHWILGKTVEDCVQTKFKWQPGWQYEL